MRHYGTSRGPMSCVPTRKDGIPEFVIKPLYCRSDNGWGVVAEYTADELAEDSDDEKRLEKAEKTLLLSAADDRTTATTDAKLA